MQGLQETMQIRLTSFGALVLTSMTIITLKLQCTTDALKPIPNRPITSYSKLGDINLGAFLAISKYSPNSLCGEGLRFPLLLQYVEAIVYAIDEINKNPLLLPNLTLGYAILDDCVKQSTAVAQALSFLPRKPDYFPMLCEPNCPNITGYDTDEHYDVVGVIGPLKSENSIAVSYVLGPAKIPQISFLATSDELSNKELHPYFLRVVPPDEFQVKAIMTFILNNGWTYISVVYSTGSYGEYAFNNIKQLAATLGICIATQLKTSQAMLEKDYIAIISELLKYPRARVVIAFLGGSEMVGMFQAVHVLGVSGVFIWVGSDGWAERITRLPVIYKDALYGSFTTMVHASSVPEFDEYFATIKPSSTSNPWFAEFWERQYNCSFVKSTCDESRDIRNSPDFHSLAQTSAAMDSVYAYAWALKHLLDDECPGVTGSAARSCVKGDHLLGYLRKSSFQGYSGRIEFDESGNAKGKYIIRQILPGESSPYKQVPVRLIGLTGTQNITVLNSISWEYVAPLTQDFGHNAKLPPPPLPVLDTETPVSVCSRLCGTGEYIQPKEKTCCWECRRCRDNEIVVEDQTSCQECPKFFWPDPHTNLTTCEPIPPDYPLPRDPVVIFEIGASTVGIVISLSVLLAYIYYRDASIIKAASRELSFLQLIGILLGYITMLVYVATPTHTKCNIAYFMFCFSLNLLYAPLLVKAIRIYRIFSAAAKGTRGLRIISPLSQVIISCFIVLGQVLISVLVAGLKKTTARLSQPVKTERYVELSCDMTVPGLTSFLAYNLTLVILCSIFAFKTRKLPDNFNESRFMSLCVTTTLVIWLAFIPTYVTSSRKYLKTLLVTLVLLLNHSVALVFLFLSKLYAVICLGDGPPNPMDTSNTGPSMSRFRSNSSHTLNTFATNPTMNQVRPQVQV